MPPIIEPTEQQLNNIVQPYLDQAPLAGGIGIAVGYASPGFNNIYFGGNLFDQARKSLVFTNDTPFELASISKTFTATLYALLIPNAQKQNPALGDFPLGIDPRFQSIPIETLVNYTSGLPADNETVTDLPSFLPAPYSTAGMLGFLNLPNSIVLAPSGTAYAYSNLGFALASAVLPFLYTGGPASYEGLIQSQIWQQLSFSHNTTFFTDVRLDQIPLGYEFNGETWNPVAAGNKAFPAYHGAGGVVSTPNDMMKWLQFNMGLQQNAVLSPLLPMLQNPSTTVLDDDATAIGLGWFMKGEISTNSPYPAIFKDGGLNGVSSFITFLPGPTEPLVQPSPAGVFVLTNSSGLYNSNNTEMSAAIAFSVLNIMQGYPALPS